MQIAELFAKLKFEIDGADKAAALHKSLEGIAAAARDAVLALKGLSQIKATRQIGRVIGAVQTAQTTAAAAPSVPAVPAAGGAGAAGFAGAGGLGSLFLKALGVGSLLIVMKRLISALKDLALNALSAGRATDRFRIVTDISTQELRKWERMAEISGMSQDEMRETLFALSQRASRIRKGLEGGTAIDAMFGLDAGMSGADQLRQIRSKLRGMSGQDAATWLNSIGISPNVVYMLKQFGDELDRLDKESVATEEQLKNIRELNKAWGELTIQIQNAGRAIMSELSPALKWFLELLIGTVKVLRPGSNTQEEAEGMIRKLFPLPQGTRTSSNTINIEVNGAGDPQRASALVMDALRREMGVALFQGGAAAV